MTTPRVVITGVGLVTPLGASLTATLAALRRGESAIAPATVFDASGFVQPMVAEVKTLDVRSHFRVPKAIKLTDRSTRFAVAAAVMALQDGSWPQDADALEMLGVVIGSSGSDVQVEDLARAIGPDPTCRSVDDMPFFSDRVLSGLNPLWLLINLPNMASAHVAIQLGARGPNSTIMTDWVAGSQAIGEAFEWIRGGEAVAVLAGGADSAIQPFAHASFEQGGLFQSGPERSAFASDRGGPRPSLRGMRQPTDRRFAPGEGAAMLLLEEREHAMRRGVAVRAEITAYATASSDLRSADAVLENALAQTMAEVLAETGWTPHDLGSVSLAGIFASPFLELEEAALDRVLGPYAASLAREGFTSHLGHALAASGPIDLGLILASNCEPGRGILCNSVGYSGQAVTLAVLPESPPNGVVAHA